MSAIVISERICPHCGENKWYISYRIINMHRYKTHNCVKCRRESVEDWRERNKEKKLEYERKRRRKHRENVSDEYIRSLITNSLYKEGIKISEISQKDIEIYRKCIKTKRIIYPLKEKNMNYTKEKISSFQKEYNEIGEMIKNKNVGPRFSSVQSAYIRRCDLKRRINSVKEYEDLAALGVESATQEDKNRQQIREMLYPVEVKPVEIENKPESIVEEFRKIEQRRNEILSQVSQFNEYVESLKIRL